MTCNDDPPDARFALPRRQRAALELLLSYGPITPSFMTDDGADWNGVVVTWREMRALLRRGLAKPHGAGGGVQAVEVSR